MSGYVVYQGPSHVKQPRVPHKLLKYARLELHATEMRRRKDGEPHSALSISGRLDICRSLLLLQKEMRCRVWVDGGVVWVGPCALTPGVLLRKPLSWEMAAMIADNPDKHLPRFLRIFNEE